MKRKQEEEVQVEDPSKKQKALGKGKKGAKSPGKESPKQTKNKEEKKKGKNAEKNHDKMDEDQASDQEDETTERKSTGPVDTPKSEHVGPFNFPSKFLQYLVAPMSATDFFQDYWEKKPLVINRKNSNYYKALPFTKTEIDQVIGTNQYTFGNNIDVSKVEKGKKISLNPSSGSKKKKDEEGVVAKASDVWKLHDKEGGAIHISQPHRHNKSWQRVLTILEERFGALFDSHLHVTPKGIQGIAPRSEDAESFILQLEGSSEWTIYNPLNHFKLPLTAPSKDLKASEIGEAVATQRLEKGDFLYFPRGYIYQSKTTSQASIDIALTTYRNNSWGHFLEFILPLTIRRATQRDVVFRKGLPLSFNSYMGTMYRNMNTQKQRELLTRTKELLGKVVSGVQPHEAIDDFTQIFVANRLPPLSRFRSVAFVRRVIDGNEELLEDTVDEKTAGHEEMDAEDEGKNEFEQLTERTGIRLKEPKAMRLLIKTPENEEHGPVPRDERNFCSGKFTGKVILIHSFENSVATHPISNEEDLRANHGTQLVFPGNYAVALSLLFATTPKFAIAEQLPFIDAKEREHLLTTLKQAGLLEQVNLSAGKTQK